MYGETPEQIRSEVIDYYVDDELTKQAAEENGISVSEEEVQAEVDAMKANYPTEEAWQSALESAGTTEEQYRESLLNAMLEKRLEEQVASEVEEPSDEELLEYAQAYAPAFSGAKRSSHILFNSNDAETAQTVLDQINNGDITFEEAVAEYSEDTASAQQDGDVGWDLLNSFVTEYTDALSQLEEGQVSDLVVSQYGIHIIKCTEVFEAPEEITSIDQVPSELVDYISDMLASSSQSTAFSKWKEEYKEKADVVTNDMPEGLPYNIDMTPYQTEESADAEATADVNVEGEGASTEETQTAEDGTQATDESAEPESSESSSDTASADAEAQGDTAEEGAQAEESSEGTEDANS